MTNGRRFPSYTRRYGVDLAGSYRPEMDNPTDSDSFAGPNRTAWCGGRGGQAVVGILLGSGRQVHGGGPMAGPSVTSLYFMSGLCAYATLNHLSLALRRPPDRPHLLLAGMCLVLAILGISGAAAYQSFTISDFVPLLKWNISLILVFFIFFIWFFAVFTGLRPRRWLLLATLLFAVLIPVNLLQPYGLQFSVISKMQALRLPWGEEIAMPVGHKGFLFWFTALVVLINFSFALSALTLAWRRNHTRVSLVMVIVMVFWLATAVEGILVRAEILHFIHLGLYGCMLTIIICSIALSRETSQRLTLLDFALDNVHEAAFLSDYLGRLHYVNAAACRFLGYGREELLTRPVAAIEPDLPPQRWDAHWEELKRKGSLIYQGRHRSKNGRILPVEISANYFTYAGRSYNLALARDISARFRAEEAVKRERKRFYDVLETLPVMICLLTQDYHVAFANRSFRDQFGEARGRCCYAYIFGAEKPCGFCETFEVFRTGRPHRWEGIGPDGSVLDVYALPFTDVDGSQLVLEMDIDITQQKQALDTLREREQFIRNILETVDEGFIVVDRDCRILSANRAYCGLVGLPEDQVIGRFCDERAHAELSQCFENREDCQVRRTFASGTAQSASHTHIDAAGKKRHVELKTYPIRDGSGEVRSVIETIIDMTENQRLEEQLRQAQKMEAIGTLAGGVAHDFNNMLSIIIGYTELILEQVDPSLGLFSNLQEIRQAAGRSADLTRQLLTFARKQPITPRVLHVNETVEGMLKMLGRLIGEAVEVKWRPGEEIWPLRMDPSQLDQILANLCINARDAIAGVGTIIIETRNVVFDENDCAANPEASPGRYVLLEVSDNGCGMDPTTLSKIFEPFFTTKKQKGTGLGLPTVYGIVKQNNGLLNVTSEPGDGTIFKIYFPAHPAAPSETTESIPPDALLQGTETILLVEDAQPILNLVIQMLENFGYQVVAASSPAAAIRLATEHPEPIDLLLTDVVMPDMNGRDLAKKISVVRPEIKCLFMSGYMGGLIAELGMLEEDIHFIQKPFSVQTLATKLREVLGDK
jgi:two-component system cell cycle sensor histidine kinase/response regulator CckA